MSTALRLTPVEARVIAALSEKSIATPQYYPMTVNAIMLASSQKSCRDPVMRLHEGEVGATLLGLADKGLCARDDAGGRVPKWRQSFQHYLLLQPPAFAVLVTLMLRGPQTQSELRGNAAALGGPADADAVARVLADLGDRAEPLVAQLQRGHGQKEARYAHTLSGPPELPAVAPPAPPAAEPSRGALAELEEKVRALEARVAALEAKNP
jgi:hypothetical protein